MKNNRPPAIAKFLNNGPRVSICPIWIVMEIGISTVSNTIAAQRVLKPINKLMPAANIAIPERMTKSSKLPKKFANPLNWAVSMRVTVFSISTNWLNPATKKMPLTIMRSSCTDRLLTVIVVIIAFILKFIESSGKPDFTTSSNKVKSG